MSDDLSRLEAWLQPVMDSMSPGDRRKLALAIGRMLRRSNAARIAANVEPDGSAMEPRKARVGRDGRTIKRRGRMFRKLRLLRSLRVRPTPEEVAVTFASPQVERTAAAHHFGLVDFVGKGRDGRTIRTRYPARRLLGFGADDLDEIPAIVLRHLKP